jgi:hypothetical protein
LNMPEIRLWFQWRAKPSLMFSRAQTWPGSG